MITQYRNNNGSPQYLEGDRMKKRGRISPILLVSLVVLLGVAGFCFFHPAGQAMGRFLLSEFRLISPPEAIDILPKNTTPALIVSGEAPPQNVIENIFDQSSKLTPKFTELMDWQQKKNQLYSQLVPLSSAKDFSKDDLSKFVALIQSMKENLSAVSGSFFVGIGLKQGAKIDAQNLKKDPKQLFSALSIFASVRLPAPLDGRFIWLGGQQLVDSLVFFAEQRFANEPEAQKKIDELKKFLNELTLERTLIGGLPAIKATHSGVEGVPFYMSLVGQQQFILALDEETFSDMVMSYASGESSTLADRFREHGLGKQLWISLDVQSVLASLPQGMSAMAAMFIGDLRALGFALEINNSLSGELQAEFSSPGGAAGAETKLRAALASQEKNSNDVTRPLLTDWKIQTKGKTVVAHNKVALKILFDQVESAITEGTQKTTKDVQLLNTVAMYVQKNKLQAMPLPEPQSQITMSFDFSSQSKKEKKPWDDVSLPNKSVYQVENGQKWQPIALVSDVSCSKEGSRLALIGTLPDGLRKEIMLLKSLGSSKAVGEKYWPLSTQSTGTLALSTVTPGAYKVVEMTLEGQGQCDFSRPPFLIGRPL